MNTTSPDTWRGSTHADRAGQRREQLLQAGFELLGSEGAAATTMRGVCRSAGLSLRYFYESFPDREALLVAVYDGVIEGLQSAVAERVVAAGGDVTAKFRAAFDAAAGFLEEDPRRGRIMFRETLADETLRIHGAATVPNFVALVAAQVGSESIAAGPENRVALPVSALSGALVSLFLDWLNGRLDTTRSGLVDYATDLSVAVLDVSVGR